MANQYQIDFTDNVRNFLLLPYTSDGTLAPNNDALSSKSSSAATSLLLFGKGFPDYGERMAENLVHLLEHFSSSQEPVRPVDGQVWFDRSGSTAQLRVYDSQKHQLMAGSGSPSPSGNQYFTISIDPANSSQEQALFDRFNQLKINGNKIRIISSVNGNQEEYIVVNVYSNASGSPSPTGPSDTDTITIQVSPEPSASRTGGSWYLGGWEYALQNNTSLHQDLDAGALWTVANLRDPTAAQDAATRAWVLAQNAEQRVGDLCDAVLASETDEHILVYDSALATGCGGSPTTGGWKNVTGSSIFLKLSTGGTVTGNLTLSGPGHSNTPGLAATEDYVNAVVGGAAGTLGSISDVEFTGSPDELTIDDIIVYNGSVWTNVAPTDSRFLDKSPTGSPLPIQTLNGDVVLAGPSHANTPSLAATQNYVLAQKASANAYTDAQVDTVPVVTGGSFDTTNQELTIDLSTTGGSPIGSSVVIEGFGIHEVQDPNGSALLNRFQGGLLYETAFQNSISYPDYPEITIDNILTEVNLKVGKLTSPRQRLVFAATGGSTVYTGDSTGSPTPFVGSPLGQANPIGDLDLRYVVGSEQLQVFVDGSKYYNSFAGFRSVTATNSVTSEKYGLWGATRTGLDAAGSPGYSFMINVNGAGFVTIGPFTGTFQVETMGLLVKAINTFADNHYFDAVGSPGADVRYAFGAQLINGELRFTSALPGTGSSIALMDTNLFSSLVGAGSPSPFTIDDVTTATTNDPNYLPADLGYKEVGRPGTQSQTFEFLTIPTAGAMVEVNFGQEYTSVG